MRALHPPPPRARLPPPGRRPLLPRAAPPGWDGVAVVVVDHGSKRAAANDALTHFAEMYRCGVEGGGEGGGKSAQWGGATGGAALTPRLLPRAASGRPVVEVAHMELARWGGRGEEGSGGADGPLRDPDPLLSLFSPTISDAVAACKAAGASRVVLAPYFLSRGRHIDTDVPTLAAAAAAEHGLPVSVAAPLGGDPGLAALVERRVVEAEEAWRGREEEGEGWA